VAQVQVVVNNVAQNPSSAYTVSSNTITFTSAPSAGTNNIYVYYTSPITQVIAPSQGTVTSSSFGVITDFTTTGNTILGDASTDTLNVGNGGLVKDASGNVGIGTTSPGTQFNVYKSTATAVNIRPQNSLGYADFGPQADGSVYGPYASPAASTQLLVGTSNSNPFTFYTNGSERMRIDSSGNLLVGTTSQVLFGKMCLSFLGSANNAFVIDNSNNSGSAQHVTIATSGAVRGSITSNGTTTAFNTSSDYRLKDNIQPMVGALTRISALNPCTYIWKETGQAGEGFIAHELAEVVPDAVTGEKDAVNEDGSIKPQGIDTSFLVATLTAAIQELKALTDTQASTITALTARIEALENK
jgi:hypothetical protein